MAGRIIIRNSARNDGPIAALLGWGNGQLRHLLKYSKIFESLDFTTICLTTPLVTFLMRPESFSTAYRKKLTKALRQLTKDEPNREIILMAFSQCGANVMASMMHYLDNLRAESFNVVGTIFDSGPTFYSKSTVHCVQNAVWSSYRGTPSKLTQKVVDRTIKGICEHQVSHNQFIQTFESTLMGYSSQKPQLFLCSSADNIIDANYVLEFSRERKQRGVPVHVKVWDDCSHVGMLRKYPDEYEAVVSDFIQVCLDNDKQNDVDANISLSPKQQWIVKLV